MTDIKYRTKKLVQNGVIRYARVAYSIEDENEDLKKQIENLKGQVSLLEETCQLQEQLITEALGPVSKYDCYS
jgi:predicted site-specific integrase-resolvase